MRALVIAITQIRDTSNNLIWGCTTMPGCIWTEVSGKAGRGQVEVGPRVQASDKILGSPRFCQILLPPTVALHCYADDIFNKEHHYFATMAPSPQRMPFREKYLRASSLLKSKESLVV